MSKGTSPHGDALNAHVSSRPRGEAPERVSISQLEAGAREVLLDLQDRQRPVVVTQDSGRPMGILLSTDEFERLVRRYREGPRPSRGVA